MAEDDDSGSGACAPVFYGVRPLLYQVVGSDPEFRKRVHRRLTHFCLGLLKPSIPVADNALEGQWFHQKDGSAVQECGARFLIGKRLAGLEGGS